jgi:HlyD family secretion protein
MIRYISILLAIAGVAVGVWAVGVSKQEEPKVPLARQPSVNPFANGVAALGFVEASGRNVNVAAPEPGIVTKVMVEVGDRVDAGQPLLQLDTRSLEAELTRAEAVVRVAEAEIERWKAIPRKEDVPPLQAAVDRSRALLSDREDQYRLTMQAQKRGAATDRDETASRFAVEASKAELAKAEGDLAKLMSGGWQPDFVVLDANVQNAKAQVASLRILIDRLTVRASRSGMILRRQVEPGEYVTGSAGSSPVLILGDLAKLNVRAQVDEEDIGLVPQNAKAIARTRGAVVQEVGLKLIRIEPFARPKPDLSGANSERVDTRVVDVLFEIVTMPKTPIYPGQAIDVFIDATQ